MESELTVASDGSLAGAGTYAQRGVRERAVEVNYPNDTESVNGTPASTVVEQTDVTTEWIVDLFMQTPDSDATAHFRGDLTTSLSAVAP